MKGDNNQSKKIEDRHKAILQHFKSKNEEIPKNELKLYYQDYHNLDFFEAIKDTKIQKILQIVKKEIEKEKKKEGMTQQMLFSIKNREEKEKKDTQRVYINDPNLNDLIKAVLPDNYNDKTDAIILSELALSLEKYRNEEMEFIKKEEEMLKEKKNNVSERGTAMISKEDEEKARAKHQCYLRAMLKKMAMPNDHFQLLLCLMKKKKEKEYEINPYIMNYKTSLGQMYNTTSRDSNDGNSTNECESDSAYTHKIKKDKTKTYCSKEDSLYINFKTNLDSFSKDLVN